MRSLIDAGRSGDFTPAIAHAMDRYREDTETNRNYAPKDLWPSTSAFRTISYRAGKLRGDSASLEVIPDADVRLLAEIELEAALHGLPEFISITSHWPMPHVRSRGTFG
ncbi:MAG TPA: hypothetical protein VG297_25815 [Bryobacteraceae bacterium]|nr:hypothetical protein [Bryobacteraceae bacterium]